MRTARRAERKLIPRRRVAAIVAALLLSFLVGAQATRPETRPNTRAANGARLAVLVVVDQLAPSVLEAAWPHLSEGGFHRLAREGVSFANCAYDHACSETGPGHATLGTGASPSVHGIVGNAWIDAATVKLVGCVYDEKTRMFPGGTDPGASAHRLLAPALGDAIKGAFGTSSTVASVSIKDRSAILPVGASADRVVWYDRKVGRFLTSSAFPHETGGGPPPWLAKLEELVPIDAYSDFTWEKAAPPAAYADLGKDDDPAEHTLDGSRAFPHRIQLATASSRAWWVEEVCASPAGLEMIDRAARFLIEDANLGKDDVPDFLSVSFSSHDLVGHLFGPESHETRDMTIRMDAALAAFLTLLDETAGPGRWNLVLSADHGIGPVPEIAVRRGMDAGRLDPDKVKLAVEAAFHERHGAPPEKQHWVAAVLDSDILLNRKLLDEKKIPLKEAQEFAAKAASAVKGVAEAVPVHAIFDGSLGRSPIHDSIRRAQTESRSVDVYVLPKPHYLFGKTTATHGTPYDYDCRVPLFFIGPGFRRGLRSAASCAPASAAPTLARVLGIAPPAKTDHPVLEEAIAK